MQNDTPLDIKIKHHTLVLLSCFAFTFLFLFCVMLFVAWIDPLQLFHDQRSNVTRYYENQRWLVPGLIRRHLNQDQDNHTVILGTSLMENILPRDVVRYTPFRDVINLSMSGLYPGEMDIVYPMIAKSLAIKTIIVALDYDRYLSTNEVLWYPKAVFPNFLYSSSYLDRLKSLYNIDVALFAWGAYRNSNSYTADIDMRNVWLYAVITNGSFKKFQDRYDEVHKKTVENKSSREHVCRLYLEHSSEFAKGDFLSGPMRTMLRHFDKDTPDNVKVIILIPPYLISSYYHGREGQRYAFSLKALVKALDGRKNFEIYAFDDVPAIVNNSANYLDDQHYGVGVIRYILKSFAIKQHKITVDNVDHYLVRVLYNQAQNDMFSDMASTVAFEGPYNEKLFAKSFDAVGPDPLSLAAYHPEGFADLDAYRDRIGKNPGDFCDGMFYSEQQIRAMLTHNDLAQQAHIPQATLDVWSNKYGVNYMYIMERCDSPESSLASLKAQVERQNAEINTLRQALGALRSSSAVSGN